jgi:hypothetical protein
LYKKNADDDDLADGYGFLMKYYGVESIEKDCPLEGTLGVFSVCN